MFQIRKGVFETNSSSTHCIVVTTDHENASPLEPDWDGTIHVATSFFGFGPEKFNDLYRKLQYVLTMVQETEYKQLVLDEIESGNLDTAARYHIDSLDYPELMCDTDGFRAIDDLMYSYCGYRLAPEAGLDVGIDHQSCEDFNSLNDFLGTHGISLERLLFDNGVYIVVTSDCGPHIEDFVEFQDKSKIEKVTESGYGFVDLDPDVDEDEADDYDDDDDENITRINRHPQYYHPDDEDDYDYDYDDDESD